MSLPLLYMQPTDDASWRSWAFNHAANHYDIVAAAGNQFNTPIVLVTTASSTSGQNVIEFGSLPELIVKSTISLGVTDLTTTDALANNTILTGFSVASNEVEISPNVVNTVNIGDSIQFLPVAPVNLTQFILDPMDPDNLGMWFYQHQEMHNQVNALLATTGYDLLSYDWDDPDEFAEWLRLNGDEHTRINAALNIG